MASTAKKKAPNKKVFDELKDLIWSYNFKWLANAAGCCPATLYNWCDGRTRHPRLTTVIKVAEALGYKLVLVKTTKASHLKLVK